MPEPMAKFDFSVPLSRVWKDKDSGKMLFEGVASNGNVDSQRERMSDNAIAKMAAADPVLLYPTHQRLAGTELGKTTSHSVVDGQLFVKGELFDDVEEARRIYTRASEGWPYEFSVGGDIIDAYAEFDKTIGAKVRVLDDLELNHIVLASSGQGSCPGTWLGIVAKTLDGVDLEERGEPMPDEQTQTCGKTDRLRAIVAKAKAGLAEFGKAGAKHTKAERTTIHGLIQSMHSLCDCADCKALIAELEGEANDDGGEAAKSVIFSDNLKARNDRAEGWWEADMLLWDLTSVLTDTVAEIVANEEVVDKITAIELAVSEFQAAVVGRLTTGTVAKTVNDNQEDRTMPTIDEQIAQKKKELEELEAQAAAAAGETPAQDAGGETPADDAAASPATTAEEGGAAGETGETPAGEVEGAGGGDDEAAKDKTIADLKAGLDQANKTIADLSAKFEKLAEKPVPGGPRSTAAGETFDKTGDPAETPDKRFEKTVEDADRLRGTAQGKAAVRDANNMVAGAVMANLGVPTQKPE